MMTLFERLSALNPDDIHAHTLSLAATEYALEADDDPALGSRRLQAAQYIRRMENSGLFDGAAPAGLDSLRRAVDSRFGLLARETSCSQAETDDGLVRVHRGFNQSARAAAGLLLPAQTS